MPKAHRKTVGILATIVLTTTISAAARAQSQPPSWAKEGPEPRVELFLSALMANNTGDGSFGLRGAYPLGRRFALEGSLSRLADDRVDIWLIDVSAKYYFEDRGRTSWYLVAGPGLFASDDLGADEPMVHLGIGAEIELGRRFYLRPEVRGRWFTDAAHATTITDFAFGFGWRFQR